MIKKLSILLALSVALIGCAKTEMDKLKGSENYTYNYWKEQLIKDPKFAKEAFEYCRIHSNENCGVIDNVRALG